jgi:hypothetical protein
LAEHLPDLGAPVTVMGFGCDRRGGVHPFWDESVIDVFDRKSYLTFEFGQRTAVVCSEGDWGGPALTGGLGGDELWGIASHYASIDDYVMGYDPTDWPGPWNRPRLERWLDDYYVDVTRFRSEILAIIDEGSACDAVPSPYIGVEDGCDCPANGNTGCDPDCQLSNGGGAYCGCDYCYEEPSCDNISPSYIDVDDGCDCPMDGDTSCDPDCLIGNDGNNVLCGCDYCW